MEILFCTFFCGCFEGGDRVGLNSVGWFFSKGGGEGRGGGRELR